MIMSRTTAENTLTNKHDIKEYVRQGKLIKGFPVVDTKNLALKEQIIGNELRVLKTHAPSFDFLANVIHKVRLTGTPEKHIKDNDRNYYSINIKSDTWRNYFAKCGDHTKRQSLMRQVFTELQTGYVWINTHDTVHGKTLEKRAPFRIMAERYHEDGTTYREIYFSKAVFKSLVTGECLNNGGDGFIEMPENLYPVLTAGDKGGLQSYNPVYKMNVYGLMKNTHKKDRIEVDRHILLKNITPEYIDERGYMKHISAADLHDSLIENARAALTAYPDSLLVKNFYLGRHGENSTIYFQTPG